MPFELFRVTDGGSLVRHQSMIRRAALASALRRSPEPTVGIDINDFTVVGVSAHLAADDLVGLGFHEVSARFDPAYQPVATDARPIIVDSTDSSLRLAGTAEILGVMLVFGSILAAVVGVFVVADTSLFRAEKTLALLGLAVSTAAVVGIGTLLRSVAILLRRGHHDL